MLKGDTKWKKWLNWFRCGLYWALPVIVFYLIFQRIDLNAFKLNLTKTNPWLVVFGICFYPLMIVVGGLRWHLLLAQYHKRKAKINYVLKHYWIGICLGFFTPASLGWDAYRVIVSGRYFDQYALNIAILGTEKLMALLTCMSMIIVLYPMVPISSSLEIEHILHMAYILFFAAVILLVIMNFAFRNRMLSLFLERFESYLSGMLQKIGGSIGIGEHIKYSIIPVRSMMEPLTALKKLLPILILSFIIQLCGAIGNQIFFQALNYDLPFIANLFVTPILFFVFLLPISFGSLGIREGAYILLYGLFGVQVETALLISFFALSGILLNNLIGGLLILIYNIKGEALPKAVS